jgi:hypothetical protein
MEKCGVLFEVRTDFLSITKTSVGFKGLKPLTPCRKILRSVKDPYSVKEILVGQIQGEFLGQFSLLCYYVSLLVTARELWWVEQERI